MLKWTQYSWTLMGLILSHIAVNAHASYSPCLSYSPNRAVGVSAMLCDVSFNVVPSFACGVALPQTGVYIIQNNTPVAMKINYVRLHTTDSLPAGSVTITANTCGTSLAPSATCNISITLNALGPFNRILQIGINSRQIELDSPIITPTVNCNVPSAPPSASFPCALNSTSSFGVLAGSGITNVGPTVIKGNLGIFPGGSVTGFPPGTINGVTHITDATATQAQLDLTTLYTCLANQPCGTVLGTADQAGVTLNSTGMGAVNVYCSGSSLLNSGTLTLNGDAASVFIFQAGSSLTLNPTANIVLTGGALASNVFGQVGSSATLGTSSVFKGTITAFTSITMNNGATLLGRTLAQNGAVTYDNNDVSLP